MIKVEVKFNDRNQIIVNGYSVSFDSNIQEWVVDRDYRRNLFESRNLKEVVQWCLEN